MPTAPERISIKRRRDEEVPEALVLEKSKKQRTSDHIFIRVPKDGSRGDQDAAITNNTSISKSFQKLPITPPPNVVGIPGVRTTQPGDEIKDFQKYKVAQASHAISTTVVSHSAQRSPSQSRPTSSPPQPPQQARRFHLTRDLSTVLRPHRSAGIRKQKSFVRPPLPTFVERYHHAGDGSPAFHVKAPIDRMVKSASGRDHDLDPELVRTNNKSLQRDNIKTFQKPRTTVRKIGQSMRDDPTIWDIESDQLADELAALAFQMDPDVQASNNTSTSKELPQAKTFGDHLDFMHIDAPDDYVFEMYIRVQRDAVITSDLMSKPDAIGYLVIDEEDEDLWDQYLRDEEEDDDWDEEDEDSNAEDNPRNDYPDEEVSSDDEFDRNLYKYRRDCSDDEQYDFEEY